MEKQDVKVGRINDLKGGPLIDQIALMQLQQKLSSHTSEQSTLSKESAERLKNIENLMFQILDELVAIKEILASSSAMNSAEESINDE